MSNLLISLIMERAAVSAGYVMPFADELAKDDYMAYQAIVYFTAKDDHEAYRGFVDALKDISGIDPAGTGFSD